MKEPRAHQPVLHARVGTAARTFGAQAVRHPAPGRYVFEGDFPAAGLLVSVVVDEPWRFEETANEVTICLLHSNYDCPDDSDDASSNCKLVKRVVHSPRWQPVVRDLVDGAFTVEIWRAPLAPEGGGRAVGEVVLADVGFLVTATVPA